MDAEDAGTEDVHLVAGAHDAGRRLDEVLAEALAIGRRAVARLLPRVRVDGRRAVKGQRVRAGDTIVVRGARPVERPDVAVLRETADWLVVDKPAGLPTVALRGDDGDSLAARIAVRFPECAAVGRAGEAGLVHRLDTGTSGLLLVARSATAYAALRAQFRAHRVEKSYLALIAGRLTHETRVTTPIGQHHASRRRMRAVHADANAERYALRPASTDVTPLRSFAAATLVRATTRTGVRHQIRVHLASIGHPLLNDAAYGDETLAALPGFLLHASALRWHDPASDRAEAIELPLPADAAATLDRLA